MANTVEDAYVKADDAVHANGISQNITLYGGRKASLPLDITIVGCGLAGLTAAFTLGHAGHRVTLVESAKVIGEVGAGIQVAPNVSRLLIRWGLTEQLERVAVRPEAVSLRRYNTGELVGWTRWGKVMEDSHGAPYYHIHRADFHKLLSDLAQPVLTSLRLGSTIVSINPSGTPDDPRPTLTLASGEVLRADLIVGADGIKSICRDVVLGAPTKATATGDAAYRAIISTDKMLADPELRPFVEHPEMTGWMGPGRHIMGYCIRGGREYNLVLLHPDNGSVESWTAEGSADKMRADFEGFEPRVEKLLKMIPSTLKWKLMDRQPIVTWVHRDNRLVLLGDACHPMLPYRAQGAALAIEDAAVLGNLLSRLSHLAQLGPLLHGYETLRYKRCSETQASSRLNQHIFHLPDGKEQEARDRDMRVAMRREARKWGLDEAHLSKVDATSRLGVTNQEREGEKGGEKERANGKVTPQTQTATDNECKSDAELEGNFNQWADPRKNYEQFGYDADEEVERWWAEGGGEQLCAYVRVQTEGEASGEESERERPTITTERRVQQEEQRSGRE